MCETCAGEAGKAFIPGSGKYVPTAVMPARCFECGSEIGDAPSDAGVFGLGMLMGVLLGASGMALAIWIGVVL